MTMSNQPLDLYYTVNSPSFFKFAKQQAKNHSNCIFVDKVHALSCMTCVPHMTTTLQSLCIEIKKEKVKSLLQKHLFGNLVKVVCTCSCTIFIGRLFSVFACSSATTTTSKYRELPTELNCQLCYVGR